MPPNALLDLSRGVFTSPSPTAPFAIDQTSWQFNLGDTLRHCYVAYHQHPNEIVVMRFEDISPGVLERVRKAVAENRFDQLIQRWTWRNVPQLTETRWLDLQSSRLPNPWLSLTEKIESLADLPTDWDGFGGNAIDDDVINHALDLVAELESVRATPDWAEPTADGAISLHASLNGSKFRFEIDHSGLVGVAATKSREPAVYCDLTIERISEFVREHAG